MLSHQSPEKSFECDKQASCCSNGFFLKRVADELLDKRVVLVRNNDRICGEWEEKKIFGKFEEIVVEDIGYQCPRDLLTLILGFLGVPDTIDLSYRDVTYTIKRQTLQLSRVLSVLAIDPHCETIPIEHIHKFENMSQERKETLSEEMKTSLKSSKFYHDYQIGEDVKTCSERDVEKFIVRPKDILRILEYLAHHDGVVPPEIKKPVRSVKMRKIVPDIWDCDIIEYLPLQELFSFLNASHRMQIEALVHLGSAKIATLIKGKSPDEIRKVLGSNAVPPAPPPHKIAKTIIQQHFTSNRQEHQRDEIVELHHQMFFNAAIPPNREIYEQYRAQQDESLSQPILKPKKRKTKMQKIIWRFNKILR